MSSTWQRFAVLLSLQFNDGVFQPNGGAPAYDVYISPYGDVFPCVQFPLPSGNLRRENFLDIWRHSSQLAEVLLSPARTRLAFGADRGYLRE